MIRVAICLTVLTGLFAVPFTPVTRRLNAAAQPFAPCVAPCFENSEPPSNDNFANAQPILGETAIRGSNIGATKEPNEPKHAGANGGASVWYKWQAPQNANYVFTTFGSSFGTVLAVYKGNSLGELTPVASNFDNPGGCLASDFDLLPRDSRVWFDAVAGTFYYIAVDKRVEEGEIHLRWGRSTIVSGRVSTVGGFPADIDRVELRGDVCLKSPVLSFDHVPRNGSYELAIVPTQSSGASFRPDVHRPNPSISPLTGDATTFAFYQWTPAHNITGAFTKIADVKDATVTCTSIGTDQISETVKVDEITRSYNCAALPTKSNYLITPFKLGVKFTPETRMTTTFLLADISGENFEGQLASYTISGRVTLPNGTGVSGVSVALTGSQNASQTTDANGNYSFTNVPHGGNYTITASNADLTFTPPSQSFNNLAADQTANFTATSTLQLILDDTGLVAALNSILLTRDPFPRIDTNNVFNIGGDRSTRITIFLANFQLGSGEPAATVVVNLTDTTKSFDIPAEAVVFLPAVGFTQVTFQLPDDVTPGTCNVLVKAHGQTSNTGVIKIKDN